MDGYFPLVVVIFLGAAWAFQMKDMAGLSVIARYWSQRFLVLACVASGVLFTARFVSKESFVISASVEGQFILTLILTWVAWFFSLKVSLSAINLFLIPLVALLWVYLQYFGNWTETFIAFSPWLWLHIVLAIAGEVLLIVSALVATAFLLADLALRRRWPSVFMVRWASLDEFERVLVQTLQWGFFLMTGGVVMGAFFASHFWDAQWFEDPKVIVAFGTWLTYAVILICRWRGFLSAGRSLAWAALCACLSIVFLAIGMDKIFPSRHPFQGASQFINTLRTGDGDS